MVVGNFKVGHLKISCKTLYILSLGFVGLVCLCMGACIFSSGILSFSAELLYLRHHFTWSYIVKNSFFVLVVSGLFWETKFRVWHSRSLWIAEDRLKTSNLRYFGEKMCNFRFWGPKLLFKGFYAHFYVKNSNNF